MSDWLPDIKERLVKTTVGPWRTGRKAKRTLYDGDGDLIGVLDRPEDADFAAQARVDIQWLIDAVEKWCGMCARAEGVRDQVVKERDEAVKQRDEFARAIIEMAEYPDRYQGLVILDARKILGREWE